MKRRTGVGCLMRIMLACILAGAVVAGVLAYLLAQPYQGFAQPVTLDIAHGTGTSSIAQKLAAAGVIRYPWELLAIRLTRPGARLQAGEYQFSKAASAWTVFDRLIRGDVFYYELAVPEGSNMFDIATAAGQLGFIRSADFLRAAKTPALIRDIAPTASSLEGYLFPSTYRLTRQTTATQLARLMTDLFRKKWRELSPAAGANVHEVVTMASLVEKETGIPQDRPKVASVYWNRLRRDIPLDCDPTTIYAALLEQRYKGVIHRSDLASENAYNTYRHTGLPPGPIASPGLESLKAALHPAETDYLFFVARPDGSGGHNFATTLAEHNRNVSLYRRGR